MMKPIYVAATILLLVTGCLTLGLLIGCSQASTSEPEGATSATLSTSNGGFICAFGGRSDKHGQALCLTLVNDSITEGQAVDVEPFSGYCAS
jgi:hypothetical protein